MAQPDDDPSFGPELFAFLRELREHNDRDWFEANREHYVAAVREPALAFVEDFAHLAPAISPRFARGAVFRIHRDTRFSKDKSPYKTHTGIHFRHEQAEGAHSLGFYLHLEPGNVFAGAGVWRPERDALRQIREAIAARPDRWREATGSLGDRFVLEGTALKRPPAGFDAEHPLIEDIKRKDFIAMTRLDEETATARGFLQTFEDICRQASPFVAFLCRAVGAPF